MRAAWAAGQRLCVHGWIYGLKDGLVRDLGVSRDGPERVAPASPPAARVVDPTPVDDWSDQIRARAITLLEGPASRGCGCGGSHREAAE